MSDDFHSQGERPALQWDDDDTAPTSAITEARRSGASRLSVSDSPCVAVCSTLYDDICRGCGRTAMEVANWVFLSEDEKREVWERIRAQGYPRRNN